MFKTNLNPIKISIPYNAVFTEGAASFEYFKQLVKSLSRTDTLFWCARLNLILADPNIDENTKQSFYLQCFFTSQQIQTLNEFVISHGGPQYVGIIHRGALLELIRWTCLLCSDHSNDGETFNSANTRESFARVLLIASDLWSKRVYGDSAFEGTSLDEKRAGSLALIRSCIMETRYHTHQFETLARGVKLFRDIFPKFYVDFHEEFQANTGLSIDEYYLCLFTIITHHMNLGAKSGIGGKQESGIFTLQNIINSAPHIEIIFKKFLGLHAISADELSSAFWLGQNTEPNEFEFRYSLKPLRKHPILKAEDGRMIILDPDCFYDQALIGPLFHVLYKKNQNKLFAAFGYAFEDYVRNIFQCIYPGSDSHLAKRLFSDVREINNKGIQVADFIIDNVFEIIVIETKAVWIQDEMISHNHTNVFITHLKTRYGGTNDKKGYMQLARNISKISAQEWQPDGIDLTKTKRIYPVLLVHDNLLDAPIFGHYLANEFKQALEPDSLEASGWMIKGSFFVAPLIVLTIDDIECLESSLATFTLADLLLDYSIATPDRMVSLNNFLAANSNKYSLSHNKSLASTSESILDDCMNRIFPAVNEII